MSCVTCDGSGKVTPPEGGKWLLTGDKPMDCPVCRGPHLQWFLNKMTEKNQVLICSHDECEEEIMMGWLIYAQLNSSSLPELDEAILLCCDEHAQTEHDALVAEGHPTVMLPFCIEDAREVHGT